MKTESYMVIQLGIGTGERAGDELAAYFVDDLKLVRDAAIRTLTYARDHPEDIENLINGSDLFVGHSFGVRELRPGTLVENALLINGPEKNHLHLLRTLGAFARMGAGHAVDSMPWVEKSRRKISRRLINDNVSEIRRDVSGQVQFVREALQYSTLARASEVTRLGSTRANIFVAQNDKVAKHSSDYQEQVVGRGLGYYEIADARHDTVLVEPAKVLTKTIMQELFLEVVKDTSDSV